MNTNYRLKTLTVLRSVSICSIVHIVLCESTELAIVHT